MATRTYNAEGLAKFTASAVELIPMIVSGSNDEIQDAIVKMYEVAREQFPSGPRQAGEALNRMCQELDLPLVFTPRNKDTGAIL